VPTNGGAPRGPFALVLQGGGALGAYELGAAERIYGGAGAANGHRATRTSFAPVVISGVSIGAISAALLGRPKGGDPVAALRTFWQEVAVPGSFLPPCTQKLASLFGNAHFFLPRTDYFDFAAWTSFYDTRPLRETLETLVDVDRLGRRGEKPRLIISATDIGTGRINYFDSDQDSLTLDHIVASGSLPPAFPMTMIDGTAYWDGGLFDNTPLGPVLDAMAAAPGGGADACIIVVNLFPNSGAVPRTMPEVGTRMLNLMFANRTEEDLKLLKRFNEVADLLQRLQRELPRDSPIRASKELSTLLARKYLAVPNIIEVTRRPQAEEADGIDFSPEGIEARAADGRREADRALGAHGL
jgi:NTE family protein